MVKLIIYRKSDSGIEAIWGDYKNNSIATIFQNKPEKQQLYSQTVLDVPYDIEKNKNAYKIVDEVNIVPIE
jgi:hypothetical protein